jgi:hypothetical protein
MLVDPLTPCFEVLCTTLVCNRAERSDLHLPVLRDIDVAYLSSLGMFIAESNVTPCTGNGYISEASEYLNYLTSRKRLPGHSLPQKLRRLVVLSEFLDRNVQLLIEKFVRIVDGFTATAFESKHLGQLSKCFSAGFPAPRETGFEIAGSHASIVLVDELHAFPFSVA